MLAGKGVTLRQVREVDLDVLYDAHTNIRNRGAYFPLGVMSQTAFRGAFGEHGFWQKTEGMLVIESPEGEIAGHVEFFRPVSYWDAFELSYQLYEDQYAGRGFVTEAVQLLVDYLFGAKKEHRIHLVIVAENGGIPPHRRQVRLHARRNRTRRVLQRRSQPGRTALLAAADRPAALARHCRRSLTDPPDG